MTYFYICSFNQCPKAPVNITYYLKPQTPRSSCADYLKPQSPHYVQIKSLRIIVVLFVQWDEILKSKPW